MSCRCCINQAAGPENLSELVVLVTGASDGIGLSTAEEFARRGARVIMACRNMAKANPLADKIRLNTNNDNVVVMKVDLSSLQSVKDFANLFLQNESRLDILVNNAGGVNMARMTTVDGYEQTFQVNHLSHFLLTLLLKDLLVNSQPSRVVNVASSAYKMVDGLNMADLHHEKEYAHFPAYSRSKLANLLFTLTLSKKWKDTGVTTYSLSPGFVASNFTSGLTGCTGCLIKMIYPCTAKSPKQGAQPLLYCSLAPGIEQYSGRYFEDCKLQELKPYARDEAVAEQLWDASLEMVKEFL